MFHNMKNTFGEEITCRIGFPIEFHITNRQNPKIDFSVLMAFLLFAVTDSSIFNIILDLLIS